MVLKSQIHQLLVKLANHEVETVSFANIADVSALREQIQAEADEMGFNIIIRDHDDPWLPIAADQLYVMRFADYAEAYGLPR